MVTPRSDKSISLRFVVSVLAFYVVSNASIEFLEEVAQSRISPRITSISWFFAYLS